MHNKNILQTIKLNVLKLVFWCVPKYLNKRRNQLCYAEVIIFNRVLFLFALQLSETSRPDVTALQQENTKLRVRIISVQTCIIKDVSAKIMQHFTEFLVFPKFFKTIGKIQVFI